MTTTSNSAKGKRILIIDDDEQILLIAKMNAKRVFESVDTESLQRNIPLLLENNSYDVVVLDMNLSPGATSGSEGLHWLREIKKKSPQTQVIVSTAFGDIDLAVSAMKLGALDFVTKPWEPNKFFNALNQGISAHLVAIANKKASPINGLIKTDLCYESNVMHNLINTIDKVAPTDADVLVLGENGTGKDIIAKELHEKSLRANGPFVKVDLGAIQESLFESELFGHTKGAFTDAKEERIGRFEAANGGTLFLDEIGNLSQQLQTKLLTALQNREITRVGSNKSIKVDIRLICATNASLLSMIQKDEFRQDLYYRIKTVELELPPLRHRKVDIPKLAHHFLSQFNSKYNDSKSFSVDAIEVLMQHQWPGNIRELENLIESLVIISTSNEISKDDIKIGTGPLPQKESGVNSMEVTEKSALQEAIKLCNGNLTKAAKELGIGRATLYRKMEKYGL